MESLPVNNYKVRFPISMVIGDTLIAISKVSRILMDMNFIMYIYIKVASNSVGSERILVCSQIFCYCMAGSFKNMVALEVISNCYSVIAMS